MLPILKHHKSSTINQDIKYLETIASTPSSPSSISPPIQQQQQQQAYLKWSQNLDYLLADELGRKLFSEYLKETQNESLLMLYMIFQCLPQCDKEEQIKTMLKCTYNAYFKNSKSSTKKKLIKLLSNEVLIESLCRSLEQKSYDEVLIRNVTQELKVCLEKSFYFKFIKSNFYMSLIDVIISNETTIFCNNLNLDEQFKYIMDVSKSNSNRHQNFIKPNLPEPSHQSSQMKSKSKSKLLNDSTTSKK